MDRIVITIRPSPSDAANLRVTDAMQQVIDVVKLLEEAERGLGLPAHAVEWRLEKATTNSPFTVVLVAKPLNPTVNVMVQVRRVKQDVSEGIRRLIVDKIPPRWLTPDTSKVVYGLFARNRGDIIATNIDFEIGDGPLEIDRVAAQVGLDALAAINVLDLEEDIPDMEAFGEVEGVMVAAGRYQQRPAIQIRSELYGFVWCQLSQKAVERFGSEHRVADVWEGKTIGVHGKLTYAKGGRLSRIEVLDIREIQAAPSVDLDTILDPDFTAGMDPYEYLEKLHEGQLA